MIGLAPGEIKERDLSWLDWSTPNDLTADGKTVLFSESGEGGGPKYAVYLRKTDGSPAIRLSDGAGMALSPDGKWALARSNTTPAPLVLLPTGVGEAHRPRLAQPLRGALASRRQANRVLRERDWTRIPPLRGI